MGMGLDNLISVKTDASGKMIPEDLEKKILEAKEQGKTPYFVNATAGTTVLGAFDPIDEIADICKKHGLWMHVDGAWGGGALLSKTYRSLLKGVEKADSMTWNPHKLMGVPQQCSLIFTRHKVTILCDILLRGGFRSFEKGVGGGTLAKKFSHFESQPTSFCKFVAKEGGSNAQLLLKTQFLWFFCCELS
jgi:selenocysteine lyase/cysteine desulfurase